MEWFSFFRDHLFVSIKDNKWIFISVVILLVLEISIGRKIFSEYKKTSTIKNFTYFLLNDFFLQKFVSFFIYSIALFYIQNNFQPFLQSLSIFQHFSGILSFFWAILIYDCLQFHTHLLFHKSDFLWQFHKAHHSTPELNASAVWRVHVLENILFSFLADIPLLLLGFSAEVIIVKNVVYQYLSVFVHIDCKYKFKAFGNYFATPHLHLWHHSAQQKTKFAQQNIGGLFNIWDKLYGTYYYSDSYPDNLGFDDLSHYPKGFWKQTLYPFMKLYKSAKDN